MLNVDAQNNTVTGDLTPPDGFIDVTGRQTVNFSAIEQLNLINVNGALVIDGTGGPDNLIVNDRPGQRRLHLDHARWLTSRRTSPRPRR